MEGHKGEDGKFYIIDVARLCSPETPTRLTTVARINVNGSLDILQLKKTQLLGDVKSALGTKKIRCFRNLDFSPTDREADLIAFASNEGAVNSWVSYLMKQEVKGDAIVIYGYSFLVFN